jgi:hypothetical protein
MSVDVEAPGTVLPVLGVIIDVTAAGILETPAENLKRDGIRLLRACDLGQVRDVLSRKGEDQPVAVRTYPTVQAAVAVALQPSTTTPVEV